MGVEYKVQLTAIAQTLADARQLLHSIELRVCDAPRDAELAVYGSDAVSLLRRTAYLRSKLSELEVATPCGACDTAACQAAAALEREAKSVKAQAGLACRQFTALFAVRVEPDRLVICAANQVLDSNVSAAVLGPSYEVPQPANDGDDFSGGLSPSRSSKSKRRA